MYDILRGISEDITDLKETEYLHYQEMQRRMSVQETELSSVKKDVEILKTDVAVLKEDVKDLKQDVKEIRQDIKELHGEVREIAGGLAALQTRLTWILGAAGLVIAMLQYLKG